MFWYNIRVRKDLLTIQQFAKLCRSTPRTLRLYEKLGLIVPIDRDRWNKYRLYDSSQGRKFFRIKLLQNFHVPLKEIGEIIKAKGTQQFLQNKTKRNNKIWRAEKIQATRHKNRNLHCHQSKNPT